MFWQHGEGGGQAEMSEIEPRRPLGHFLAEFQLPNKTVRSQTRSSHRQGGGGHFFRGLGFGGWVVLQHTLRRPRCRGPENGLFSNEKFALVVQGQHPKFTSPGDGGGAFGAWRKKNCPEGLGIENVNPSARGRDQRNLVKQRSISPISNPWMGGQ